MPAGSSKKRRRTLRIGKYDVEHHIATGGMGAVYYAVDNELGRPVALKILSPELAVRPNMVERFRREARSAAKLRHEHIVSVYECGADNDIHFLALEFVDGIDLHEYIRDKGRLDVMEARRILFQAAKALKHAHRHGVIHRDIKPSNFLLTEVDGKPFVKLTDFGLARQNKDDDFRVTKAGTTVGTVDYMSPEQARDSGSADVRSDIYSLGCTFYHMLAGNAPFPEGSLAERLMKHADAEPPDIREFNPEVPEGIAFILRRMLAKKPDDRYQTPLELLRDLATNRKIEKIDDLNDRMASLQKLAEEERAVRPLRQPVRKRPSSTAVDTPALTKTMPATKRPPRSKPQQRKVTRKEESSLPWLWIGAGSVLALIMIVVLVALAT